VILLKAIATMLGVTTVIATLLVWASRKLRVAQDPRIDDVEQMLPNVNCGACGYPSCRAFAEALVAGKAQPALCSVSDDARRARIARFLSIDVGHAEKRVARLACAGGRNVARNRAHYVGLESCAAAAAVGGGPKACAWGCLGFGDCVKACKFDALYLNEQSLPVVREAPCTACGDCVRACPKDLFSIHPASHRLWVACKNPRAGDELLADCEVACTACGRCAMDAPGIITMRDNLPAIDYGVGALDQTPIQRCPTGAIVWLREDGTVVKGAAARKVFRKAAMEDVAT
jgi:Na+-translocating ferredoxin:NAD+ oxidoreductase RNF subunit RnfB